MNILDLNATLIGLNIVKGIQAFLGPLLLFGIGVIAIKHLTSRQMMQFFQFLALAVLVLVLFYTPGVLLTIVNTISSWFGGGSISDAKGTGTGNTQIGENLTTTGFLTPYLPYLPFLR